MNAYIVAGYRTAVGKAIKGGFRFTRPDDLASDVIKHLMASMPAISHEQVDDLIVGNVLRTVVIKKVAKNGFQEYMKSIGKLGGQNKLPRLSNDRSIVDFF